MIAISVRADLSPKAWPLIEKWVSEALAEGNADIAPAFVKAHLERGSMQLWLAWEDKRAHGCCITETAESVRGKSVNLVVVAGLDFKRWRPLTQAIKDWAREQGCVRLEAGGRKGWTRYVKSDGWRAVRTVIEMEL
jgi:hypothetical protein